MYPAKTGEIEANEGYSAGRRLKMDHTKDYGLIRAVA
jgi:hypothetical protein